MKGDEKPLAELVQELPPELQRGCGRTSRNCYSTTIGSRASHCGRGTAAKCGESYGNDRT